MKKEEGEGKESRGDARGEKKRCGGGEEGEEDMLRIGNIEGKGNIEKP